MNAVVTSVSRSAGHTFSKTNQNSIRLLAGLGVEGDAHFGMTVQHRSRVAQDPSRPNLRQVHLIHAELFDALQAAAREEARRLEQAAFEQRAETYFQRADAMLSKVPKQTAKEKQKSAEAQQLK